MMESSKFTLVTPAGEYHASSLLELFLEVLIHRLHHWVYDGHWSD